MTTLQIDTERTWRGGEGQALSLAVGLRDAGERPIIVAQPRSPFLQRATEAGLEVRPMRMRGDLDLVAATRIASLARSEKATLIHAHTSHAHALALLASCLGGRAKVVVSRRVDFPVRGSWKYGRGVARFIAISEAVRGVLVEGGVEQGRISIVHSGINLARIDTAPERDWRSEFGFAATDFVVGNVAALADHKGQRYLLDAVPLVLAKHPTVRFLIVGQGELWDELHAQAARLGVERQVVFTGFRHDVPTLLKGFSLFVMASHLEGLCTSLLDAMAARCPIVATTAGGIPEVVTDGHDGLLVPPRDPTQLAAAIVRLVEDRSLAERLAANGRETVEGRFSARQMVEGTRAVYRELLGG